jgi:hypothetical protein
MEGTDVRSALGLPPNADEATVSRRIADLKAMALDKLVGPADFIGIAEGAEAAVFEKFYAVPLSELVSDDHVPTDDGTAAFPADRIEMVQLTPVEGGTRVIVRVSKPAAEEDGDDE